MKAKKIISLFLSVLMMVSVLPLTVSADTYGDFEYNISGPTATITGYTGAGGAVEIPKTITVGAQEYNVTSIGEQAFFNRKTITNLTIPEGVTSIGRYALGYCEALESINLPESLISIGEFAFSVCKSLKSIKIPANVKTMSQSFEGCTGLTEFVVDINNQNYSSEDGVLFDKNKTELIHYPASKSGTYYAVPDSVVTIAMFAFYKADKLTEIYLHDGITTIGSLAFTYCTGLTNVTVPKKTKTIGTSAFAGCQNLESITLPYGLERINDNAFSDCTSLKSINIPGSVIYLGDQTFQNCQSLESIVIPTSIVHLGDYTFSGCTSLKSIDIPDSVTHLGLYLFNKCHSLEKLVIPASVTSTDYYVINECYNLKQLVFAEGTAEIPEHFISNCPSITDVVIPASVTSIGNFVFASNNVSEDVVFHYLGTEEQWDDLQSSTGDYNSIILGATPHYPTFKESKVATCAEEGYKNAYVCEECGIVVLAKKIFPTTDNHKYMSITTRPTCTQDGYINCTCLTCGKSFVQDGEKSLGHSYGDWEIATAPTCEQLGLEVRTCTNCSDKDYRTTDAIGHQYSEWETVVAPSCQQHGVDVRTCACGASDYQITPSTDHSYTNYAESESAKCGQNAKETAKCDYGCGSTDTREVDGTALQHTDADKDGYCDYDNVKMYGDCDHICHSDGWFNRNIYWPIIRFFWKLFNVNQTCDCGVVHY